MKEVLLTLLGIAFGVLLMAAPYYAEVALKAYAVYFFWGGLTTIVVLVIVMIKIFRRGKTPENGDAFVVNSRIQLPTLEATRNSTIDATGASIPGDLPFQFAKADDHSLIAMPGIAVTRKDDGTLLVTPGNNPTQFPPPTGEFSTLSNDDLKRRTQNLSENLREFQRRYDEDARNLRKNEKGQIVEADFKTFCDPYALEYKARFVPTALSFASEFLSRLESVTPTSTSVRNGATMILHRAFAGPTPASDAADFLDYLRQQLPN